MLMTSPAFTLALPIASIIFVPKSYTVSISLVFMVNFPVFAALANDPTGLSISISTTSPSIISVSSLIRTPIALRNACVNASVLLISMEKISLAAMDANGVSSPRDLAMPMAIAVLPVPG